VTPIPFALRALAVGLLAVVALVTTQGSNAHAAFTTQDARRGPARILIVAKEFSYALSRPRVSSGRVIVQLANAGEDVHNLRLRRRGAKRHRSLPRIDPGRWAGLDRKLKPGRYYLWCSVTDHEERGMRATLRVKRR